MALLAFGASHYDAALEKKVEEVYDDDRWFEAFEEEHPDIEPDSDEAHEFVVEEACRRLDCAIRRAEEAWADGELISRGLTR